MVKNKFYTAMNIKRSGKPYIIRHTIVYIAKFENHVRSFKKGLHNLKEFIQKN